MKDNLSFKNIFKRETKLATYIVICMTIVVLSLSYAMFFKIDGNSKNQVVEAGDLVFFLDYETMDKIGHCGIYIGDGNFIHASSGSGYCVKINSLLPGEYYNTRFCATRRVI